MSNFIKLFKQHVGEHSDKAAVVFYETYLTYSELDSRTDTLAKYITSHRVNREEIIPLVLERDHTLIIAMLAVLKAGATFLPISPMTPCNRIKFIFEDTKARLVLANIDIQHLINADIKVVHPSDVCESNETLPTFEPKNHLAYVMYTSGSTGNPKGVLIEHHSMMNLFSSMITSLNITNDDVFLALTDYTFDISLIELLMPLLCGSTIVLTEQGAVADGVKIKRYLEQHPITVMQATPLTWTVLLKQGWTNHGEMKILVGGEKFTTKLANQLSYHKENIWNVYGPTETSMWSMANRLKGPLKTESVPLGFPLNNTTINILDDDLRSVSLGQQGELYIGGDGLARGYLNNPELTHEKFIVHPQTNERLYRTGDLVFLHDEKTICYVGRIDNQLKYGGIRIEASEIEAAIEQESLVKKAIVKVHEIGGFYKSLAAYVEIDEEKAFSEDVFSLANDTSAFMKNIYDETYNYAEKYESGSINNCGWQSAFTGELISISELDESYRFIRTVLYQSNLKEVLEVGCGTGSLLFEYLDNAEQCTVVELSSKAIEYVKSKLSESQKQKLIFHNEPIQNIHHHQKYTCVIMNSVIQYLPSIHTLIAILKQLVNATKPNGTIIIGDVRSIELLDLYQLEKIRINRTKTADIESQLSSFYYKSRDTEIALSPCFFYVIKSFIAEISHIDINIKHGRYVNELNDFRYDVVIHVSKHVFLKPAEKLNFNQLIDESTIFKKIESFDDMPIIIREIPNLHISDIIQNIDTAIPKHPLLDVARLAAISSETRHKAAKLLALTFPKKEILLQYGKSGNINSLDMYIYPMMPEANTLIRNINSHDYGDYKPYCREPFNPWIQKLCFEHIKLNLSRHIMSWVNPSVYIWVEKWPMTLNGKLDNKKLLLPNHVTRADETEKSTLGKLESIWRNITGDIALIDKTFWVHGISSLNMYFFLASINEVFKININYHEFHSYNTIEKLSKYIDKLLNPHSFVREQE